MTRLPMLALMALCCSAIDMKCTIETTISMLDYMAGIQWQAPSYTIELQSILCWMSGLINEIGSHRRSCGCRHLTPYTVCGKLWHICNLSEENLHIGFLQQCSMLGPASWTWQALQSAYQIQSQGG